MSSQKIKAVAFDMDGTMFNTEDLYDQVGQILLERRGQQFTRQLKLEMMGLPGNVAFQIMKDRCNLEDSVEQLKNETHEIFGDLLEAEIQTMPGLEKLIDLVEEHDLPKCVCTSSQREFAIKSLNIFDLLPRFEFILTSEDVANGKPAPDIYLLASQKFGITPSEMLVLEDSYTGSKSGAASGAITVAIPTQHSLEMDFSHVHFVAKSLSDPRIRDLIVG